MDSRLVHCGGANASATDRVLFYFSWLLSGACPTRQVSSLLPAYREQLRFGDWRRWTAPDAVPPPSEVEEFLAPALAVDTAGTAPPVPPPAVAAAQ